MFVITDIGKLFLFFTYHDNHVIHGSRILFFLDYGSQKINSVDHVSRETPLRPLWNDSLRDLQSRFSKGQNSSKGLNFKKSEEKPLKVLIVESFEGDDEKAHYANFKHIFI